MPTRATAMRGFRARLEQEHDGDTFRVLTDGGFDSAARPWLRLYDASAPELLMMLPPAAESGGTETTEYVNRWLAEAQAADPDLRWYLSVGAVLTTTTEPNERTTFRRYLAGVWRHDDWPQPWATPPPAWETSLNFAVKEFVIDNGWPTGKLPP
jgi:hypothetical protein